MIWILIIGIILALLLLLLMTRVGVNLKFDQDVLLLDLKIGLFSIRLLPGSEKKKKETEEKKPDQTAKAEPVQKKQCGLSFRDIKEMLSTLWPPLKKALNRTRRGIRIHPLTVSVIVGAANDPAAGAELYGWIHAGVWTVMPQLEQVLVIPKPSIHVGIDFDEIKTKLEGSLGLSSRVGTLLRAGLTIAIPALKWFLKWKKQQKTEDVLQNKAEDQPAA